MWVFEELVDGKKLTEIINEQHENIKYLKGFTIPDNVVSLLKPRNPSLPSYQTKLSKIVIDHACDKYDIRLPVPV